MTYKLVRHIEGKGVTVWTDGKTMFRVVSGPELTPEIIARLDARVAAMSITPLVPPEEAKMDIYGE